MRQYIIILIALAVLGMASMGYAEDKKEKATPVKVEQVKEGVRVSCGKDAGVFAEVGGREPSHQEPKGEKHGSVGVFLKFGGSKEKQ